MIPAVEVFRDKNKGKTVWEATLPPINHSNKLEWFDNFDNFPSLIEAVLINGKEKDVHIYLCSQTRGWINWNEFTEEK